MTAADRPSVPRVGDTITTAEQLDALPDGVVVMLPTSKVPAVRFEDVWFVPGFEEGQPSSGLRLPTTVLYVPGEQPCRHCGSCDGPPSCPDCDHADRPSVTDDTRDEAAAALRSTVDLDPRSDFDRGYAHGWHAAAEWAAGRAETTTAHECDSGGFDRTICDCGAMHSYCTICGTRQDDCPHGTTTATPPGLTVSEDGSVLNWQGVNYVPQRAETATATDQALAEAWAEGHRTGWEHCQDGNYGNDHWDDPTPNPYAAADRPSVTDNARAETTTGAIAREAFIAGAEWAAARAETTTATTEDVARVLDDVIQHLRKIWSTGHDEAREVIDAAEELLVQALPHLTTARARPTREQIDRAVGEVLVNAANHPDPVAVLGRSIAPLRTKITDAVLELLRDGAR